MDKSMRSHVAHHTKARDDGARTYEWTFADESKALRVAITWSASGTSAAHSHAFASATVIRAGDVGHDASTKTE
jgi:hypothetical protein